MSDRPSTARVPAPDGASRADGKPVTVLPDGAFVRGYRLNYHATGGMSVVYRACMAGLESAVKEVEAADSARVIALGQEKATLERLEHPGIVKVHDYFAEDGFYYLVMDFVPGLTLTETVARWASPPIDRIVDWGVQLCDILHYLHGRTPPIIYRDLKPKNILLDEAGRVHLVDFGIARLHKQARDCDTELLGTALTASPEHYGRGQTDPRSDVYTLGATLHHALTGGRGDRPGPFRYPKIRSLNPAVPPGLERVVERALQIEPALRFQSAEAMQRALLGWRGGVPADEESTAVLPVQAGRSHRWWGWGVIAVLLLVVGLGWLPRTGDPVPAVVATSEPTPGGPSTPSPPQDRPASEASVTPVVVAVEPSQPPPRPASPPAPTASPAPAASPEDGLPRPAYPTRTPAPPLASGTPEAGQGYRVVIPPGYRPEPDPRGGRLYVAEGTEPAALRIVAVPRPPGRDPQEAAQQVAERMRKDGLSVQRIGRGPGGHPVIEAVQPGPAGDLKIVAELVVGSREFFLVSVEAPATTFEQHPEFSVFTSSFEPR